MGLILFGSYLPDIPSTNNTFPVPVLSAVGTLDGLTMSIAYRYVEIMTRMYLFIEFNIV